MFNAAVLASEASELLPDPSAEETEDAVIGLQDEVVIDIVNSTIPYDGQFFGDWMVFYHGDSTDEQ